MAENYSETAKVYETENLSKLSIHDMLAYSKKKALCGSQTLSEMVKSLFY